MSGSVRSSANFAAYRIGESDLNRVVFCEPSS
jgi:hypothetical protein